MTNFPVRITNAHKYYNKGKSNQLHVMDNVTLELPEQGLVAIFGRSGCGKTTLFKILTGEMDYDDGEVFVNPHKRIGLISQIPRFPEGYRVEDVLRSAFAPLMAMKRKMEDLELAMADGVTDDQLREYDRLGAAFQAGGGYDMDVEVDKISNGLGITAAQREQLFDSLSGGEKTRVNLARLLLEKTDILLLDEPTNDLDLQTLIFLEEFIRQCRQSVLFISHDESLLENQFLKSYRTPEPLC